MLVYSLAFCFEEVLCDPEDWRGHSVEVAPVVMNRSGDQGVFTIMASAHLWHPIAEEERYVALDALRGTALFGVLLVNLETLFRVSLFEHMRSRRGARRLPLPTPMGLPR
jgi:hypothetical protein